MLKIPEKSQREIPAAPEEVRYKKKSRKSGLSRSKHKHEYKTVLLHHKYSHSKPHEQDPLLIDYLSATKVCQICGRIGNEDPDFYKAGVCGSWLTSSTLIPEAFELDKWHVDECMGTFAQKECGKKSLLFADIDEIIDATE